MANNEQSEAIMILEQAQRDIADLIDAIRTGEGRIDTAEFISGDLERVQSLLNDAEWTR